ncbi:methionyl-tRNA formyltransferase [Cellvibrio sp. pealriver]|uniref:methionyl-tRNA formyltransferase n=1 Tax=Cellvibrio sp. pealriver TaxID=1622269 RepID=UPI00066FED17|nr:methionyl-tRNA formyltransferase [Cellvibrio sp. pealriver]
MSQGLRIIFAGTPEFAAEHLKALLGSHHHVIAVYSQPDRPAGRGKKLTASPVKEVALAHAIPVYQPLNFKSPEAVAELASLNADLMVVVAYGLILPKIVLDTPRLGCINVHASILPRWRGAAPIQRAIEAGDTETGVTIMQMDVGLDTGDMLIKAFCPILPDDTGGSLHDKLIHIGTPALLEALDLIQSGLITPEKQDDSQSNYAPKLSKEEAALNWQLPSVELERKVRAFNPFPVAHTKLAGAGDDQRIRVWAATFSTQTHTANPGSITRIDPQGLWIACAQGQLILEQLQLPGKKAMTVTEILRGHPDLFKVGDQMEQPPC